MRPRVDSAASSCTLEEENDGPLDLDPDFVFSADVIDLTDDAARVMREGELSMAALNVSNRFGHQRILRGDVVEVVAARLGEHCIDFIRVEAIVFAHGNYKLRGTPFIRTRCLRGMLPKKLNEVCAILYVDNNNRSANSSPLLIDVAQDAILGKRILISTNTIFPDHCSRHVTCQKQQWTEGQGVLVHRWNFRVFFVKQSNSTVKPIEEALERVSLVEASSSHRIQDEKLSNRWRGMRIKGGSWNGRAASGLPTVHLDTPQPPCATSTRLAGQRYTLFDAFSGAGGVSRGSQSAGFKVLYGLDKSPEVWETYRLNFPQATLHPMSIDEFIRTASIRRRHQVDVLHLSPPCQYFSPAHTRDAAHDDDNIFALFACRELINYTRPRLITLEQTFGIVHQRHRQYFHALISDFTQLGFSIRWSVIRLSRWGLAQDRKRLIMIAAAPGEQLPSFPPPTHCEGGDPGAGLKPFTTLAQVISRPGRTHDVLHDLGAARRYNPPRPSLSGRLVGTITTGGSATVYYPDGTRDLTLREFASLQGFPHHHHFRGNKTSIMRQIGNAFPPSTVQVLYNHLRQCLLRQDGIQSPPVNAIIIDQDDHVPVVDLT
ncbi:hypothetical protein CDD81_7395 [Ophiocordyceps australis]|uniref:DNA (cytosine-5-)-methyltransferase n=1 Tax=Ophiocordyceps australis TaxID=1399860 RepID=A0A2C5YFS6_9HYPO|nr:hypothetical protein CDD81_7395 [Ophiocordyceps australis]